MTGRSSTGDHEVPLEADGAGGWQVDGEPAPELAGCLDVDLEASAFTNAFPVHRLALSVGGRADAPAAYVRAPISAWNASNRPTHGCRTRATARGTTTHRPPSTFAPYSCTTKFGLALDYPGIAVRVA